MLKCSSHMKKSFWEHLPKVLGAMSYKIWLKIFFFKFIVWSEGSFGPLESSFDNTSQNYSLKFQFFFGIFQKIFLSKLFF